MMFGMSSKSAGNQPFMSSVFICYEIDQQAQNSKVLSISTSNRRQLIKDQQVFLVVSSTTVLL